MVTSVLDRIDKKNAVAWMLLSIIAVVIGMVSLNYVWSEKPGVDSGIFATTGLHLLHGKTLYVEIWDNKPPLVYLMNALALGVGGEHYRSIRQMELIFAVVGALTFVVLIGRMFRSVIAAAFGLLVYMTLMYEPLILELGNLTEEYFAVFWLIGSLLAFEARKSNGNKSLVLSGLAGCSISLTLLLKEPFLLSMVPVLCCISVAPRNDDLFHPKSSLVFAAGVALPGVATLIWLWLSGAMPGWIDIISYNIVYSSENEEPEMTRLAGHFTMLWQAVLTHSWMYIISLVPFFASLFHRPFVRGTHYAPWFVAASLVFSFLGVCVSGRHYGHYFMQLVPALALAAGGGAAFLSGEILQRYQRVELKIGVTFLLIITAGIDYQWFTKVFQRWAANPGIGWEPGPLDKAIVIRAKSNDTMWVNSGYDTYHYVATGLLSPTPYLGYVEHWFRNTRLSTGAVKKARTRDDLIKASPAFLIINQSMAPNPIVGIDSWVKENYHDTGISESNGESRLFLRNDRR